MASEHGGARNLAGRKRKLDKHDTAINEAEKRIRDRLPEIIDNLFELAGGGYERVEREYQPAGLIFIENRNEKTGDVTKVKAFPNLPDDQMVLIRRKVSIADKDRAANIYLADRIMGKPIQKIAQTDSQGNDIPDAGLAQRQLESALLSLRKRTRNNKEGNSEAQAGQTAGDSV